MSPSKRASLLALAAFAVPFALAACDSNVDEKIALAKLAQSCLVNSDCSAPLVCAFEACHAECESSRDCSDGARCVAAARPYKVCQLEEERQCQRTSNCAEGLVCGVDGECRDQCSSDNDCVEGQLCVSGTCADTDELDDSGRLTPAAGKEQGSEGAPCVYVSDCSGALLCRGQACLPECKADRDCDANEVCQDTRCVTDGSEPLACDYNSDCRTELGQRCLGGGCRCMCAENRDCPAGQSCDGCGCVPAPDAPKACNYNSDCHEPGQICKDHGCACECKSSEDCADGQLCDGCGCVTDTTPVGGIIAGSITIDSSLQLPQYRGVTEVYGDVYVNGTYIADLGDTFDQLRLVSGRLMFYDNPLLTRISVPKLEQANQVTIETGPNITEISLPLLNGGYLSITTVTKLETLNLDSFQSGSLNAFGLGHLKLLSLPEATELGYLTLHESLELERIALPKLAKVPGSFEVQNGSPGALASLEAPKLTVLGQGINAGYLRIGGTQLTTLTGFGAPTGFDKSEQRNLQLSNNPLLGSCAVEEFRTRLTSAGFSGDVMLSDNGPTCGGSCSGPTCGN